MSPLLRITIGLLLLTISLLLISDLLGFVPNKDQGRIDSRKAISEALAVQVTTQVSDGRMDKVKLVTDAIIKHSSEIESIGLRSLKGGLEINSGKHSELWLSNEQDKSTSTEVLVPIFDSQGKWGQLEVKFKPLNNGLFDFNHQSLLTLILFVTLLGFLFYWLFLKRVLSELDPSSAVPERVRSALNVLSEGMIILDKSERIVLVNKALSKKIGVQESDLIGKNLASLDWILTTSSESFKAKILPWTELFETKHAPKTQHLKLKTECKGLLSLDVNVAPIYGSADSIKGVVVSIDDISELDKKNAELALTLQQLKTSQDEILRQNIELAELATRDPLTSALNRRSLFEGFKRLLEDSADQQQPISCFIMDIDHFKGVNDNYGHAMGDYVIKVVADILHNYAPNNGLVGRYGGEEFVVVLPNLTEMEAAQLAEQIRLDIESHELQQNELRLQVTASFGVTTAIDSSNQPDALVDQSDQALYKAKQSGRNRVVRYSNIESNQQEVILVDRMPKNRRVTDISDLENKTNEQADLGLEGKSVAYEILDEKGKLTIEAFDKMGSSSRIVVLDRLSHAIKQAKRDNTKLAVLTIYIDTIQTINNLIGYGSAEKLRKVAFKRLNNIFRASDSVLPDSKKQNSFTLSRSGDNEFTAILNNLSDPEMLTWITQRLFADLKEEIDIDGTKVVMTANVGVTMYPNDGESAESLLSNSSMALDEANKQEQRETVLFFDSSMTSSSRHQLEVEGQLYRAIEREEFELYYQPIINLKSGRVEKWEALIRWQHPELGIVSPDSFMAIAENSGVIKDIGIWIIDSAISQLQRWHADGYSYLKMSINISAEQFSQLDLAKQIIEKVNAANLMPGSFIIEITETAIIKQLDRATQAIVELQQAGFEIALDDFGTGYSSLDLLRKFPIKWVKIDRSFMLDFPYDINDVSIVSGLIGLAHNLGMQVIAEGVEEENQVTALLNLGCDQMQGFMISRAVTSEQATVYMQNNELQKIIDDIKQKIDPNENSWESLAIINEVISKGRAS